MSHTTYCQCGSTSWSWDFIQMIRTCPRVTDVSKHRSDRIKAIGNGQVPRVAAAAFSILYSRFYG